MNKIIVSLLLLFALPAQAEPPKRVVAIGGALTEIIYALNAQDVLVGNDTTGYYPPEAEKLPKVGYQRTLSAEGILSLKPDIVMLTEEAGPATVLQQLKAANVSLLQLKSARSLDDIKSNVETIAHTLGKEEAAKELNQKLMRDLEKLDSAKLSMNRPTKVMFILQHGGGAPMVAGKGTAADSIITLSGARNVADELDGYKPLTPESATSLEPDILLITKQGLEQIGGEEKLFKSPGIALTPAGKSKKIIVMDSLLLLGFGPRTAQAALELTQAIQGL